jgi:hypothetical protein
LADFESACPWKSGTQFAHRIEAAIPNFRIANDPRRNPI